MATTPDASFEPQALLEQLPFVRALARRLLEDPAAAEDVAQDAVVAALEQQPPAATLRPWLSGVTRNLARLLFRRDARRSNRERAAATREILPSASDESVRFEALRRVVLALDRLAPDERALLVRRFYDEWPPRRIAADLGVPVNTVRTRIARALANLRRELVGARPQDEPANLRALLIPLLTPPAASSLLPFVPLVAGGLLVSTKVKLALAAALVGAASVCVAIWPSDGSRSEPAQARATVETAAAATAAAAETAATRVETMTEASRTTAAPDTVRGRTVALRGRLLGAPDLLARWSTPLEVVAAIEVVTGGRIAAQPAPQRLLAAVAVGRDGTFAADLQLDADAPRISRLTLTGVDPCFAPVKRWFAVPVGAAGLEWNVEAQLFPAAIVRGRVVDAQGLPVPDSAVSVFAIRKQNTELLGEATVDEAGEFAVAVNSIVPCHVVAAQLRCDSPSEVLIGKRDASPRLLPAVVQAKPSGGHATDVGDLVLRPGATIRGRVEWFAHGPVAGAIVSARPFVRTIPATNEYALAPGSAFSVAKLTPMVELPSGRPARLVSATDENGEFEIAGLPPGPTRVELSKLAGGMNCMAFAVVAPSLEVDAPADGVVLRFDGAIVEYEVTSDGKPVENAMVMTGIPAAKWRATWNGESSTGPEGRVESVIPPNIAAHWQADAQGYASSRGTFSSPVAGDRVAIRVELYPLHRKPALVIHLADESGAPVTTAGIQWERVEEEGAAASQDERVIGGADPWASDGRFVLYDIAPAAYRMQIRPGGAFRAGDGCYAEIERVVTIRANQIDELEIVAVAAGRLRATALDAKGRLLDPYLELRDERGIEVPAMPIRRRESDAGEWLEETFQSGRLSTEGPSCVDPPLAPGRYTATFTLDGYAPKSVTFEIRPLQPCDLEVVLDPLR
jgi:RNA polymerase sigma-70 factor (ECF subfamily)